LDSGRASYRVGDFRPVMTSAPLTAALRGSGTERAIQTLVCGGGV
jgi:hypothetical protein